jgi:aspartyl-tRNA synthetase
VFFVVLNVYNGLVSKKGQIMSEAVPTKSGRTLISETLTQVGEVVQLEGWVATKRDHGKLTFIDLRDRSGQVQCVGYQKMGELTPETVIRITGLVKQRPERMVNANIPTGTIEVDVQEYVVLNKSAELPIPIDGDGYEISEEVRLRYRYLDLRRERLNRMLRLRSQFTRELRDALYKNDFVEVETPMLTKSTKEGARDFIVPSRFNPGKFYALPQSPQQYKQLLMTAGVERYFQVARCIRDEDLRADRGFEFTQLDVEMSFVNQQQVMKLVEETTKQAVKAVGGQLQQETFPVVTYQEAMAKYGADRFDLRSDEEKEAGVLAFAWVVDFPFFKQVDRDDVAEVRDGKSGWTFTHNPFSAPLPEHKEWHLKGERLGEILTSQYDLVCNGYEVGGGSIRAHEPEVLRQTFRIMGYSDQEIEESVGHMLEAFQVGTPPHGGIALGMDRLVMLLTQERSLKEVIPFPMTASGRTAVMDAPATVSEEQMVELGIQLRPEKK